jgi:N-acyl homoserine lactone hydrolase
MPTSSTEVSKLYVLLCGYEILRKSDSTRGRDARFVFASPISAYLVEAASGLILIDTGVNPEIIRDPGLCEQYYTSRGWTPPIVHQEHELLHQLEHIGVRAHDVERVLLTHMHMDHTGNLKHFRHARVSVQRREHAYAFGQGHSPAWFDIDYDFPDIHWELQEGDWEPLAGLNALATYGHTPGHQSFLVELPETGPVLVVGDVGDLAENFAEELLPGETSDDAEALDSIRRVNRVAAERNAELFIGHDPGFVHRAQLAPAFYH